MNKGSVTMPIELYDSLMDLKNQVDKLEGFIYVDDGFSSNIIVTAYSNEDQIKGLIGEVNLLKKTIKNLRDKNAHLNKIPPPPPPRTIRGDKRNLFQRIFNIPPQ